jgi:hypothetical protein
MPGTLSAPPALSPLTHGIGWDHLPCAVRLGVAVERGRLDCVVAVDAHIDLVVRLAAQVAKYGFSGSWRFGLAVAGIDGADSFALAEHTAHDGHMPVYTEPMYQWATTASLAELQESPRSVVRDLVGQLLRALKAPTSFRGYSRLSDPDAADGSPREDDEIRAAIVTATPVNSLRPCQ